jgi:hypothetical protein
MFFPYYIALHKDDPTFNVSTAYGFSVLSSVLGGAYSLAVMVNIGYRVLLLHAVACYALIAIGVMISRLWSKKSIPNQ